MGKTGNICHKTGTNTQRIRSKIGSTGGHVFDCTCVPVYRASQDFIELEEYLEDLVDRLADL